MCFDLKKWRPKSHEDVLFLEIIRNTVHALHAMHKKWHKIFLGKFGEIWAKILRTSKFCLLLHLLTAAKVSYNIAVAAM